MENGNKTVTLTPEEVEFIKEDVASSVQYLDQGLSDQTTYFNNIDKEYDIKQVRIGESILKKLG